MVDCPSEDTFVRVLAGRSDPAKAAAFHTHVERCVMCKALLSAIASGTAHVPGSAPTVAPISGHHPTAFAIDSAEHATNAVASMIGPGARVHQYELIRELGRGGMGMVWAARDTKLGRRVAIKFLLNASRGVAERFLTEARATAQCSHDNIVIIHEVDEIGTTPYMVLEFLEGQVLRELIHDARGPLPASRVVELVLPIARALARAHELRIVHRDLKPENVFVTNAGQVKVLDFGIAKALGSKERTPVTQIGVAVSVSNLTREGTMIGTLPYMSPEQMGVDEVDHRTDIWALGIMMFEMLAGHHPLDPLTVEGLLENATAPQSMPSIRDLLPDLSDGLGAVVDGCLRKRKDERIAQASDLVELLEKLVPGRQGRRLAEGESPYPGLTAFQEADADRFFGRERDVARMLARVRELPITGIIGPSGVGKSSLIRAGVGPAFKASDDHWDVVTLRPGRQPLAAIASAIDSRSKPELIEQLRAEPGHAGTVLRDRARQTGRKLLLFIDQFEELYTLVADPDEQRAFTAALAAIGDDAAAPLRVVVSMRSDFLDRVDPRFMEDLARGLVFLSPPDADGLREALVQPLEMVGVRFESAAMVEDMIEALEGAPGALPLVQFAAAKLWDARDRKQRLLTVSSYNAIGGISGALATHADDVVAAMSTDAQKMTRTIFRRLVTPDRTRAVVELADLQALTASHAEIARTIDQLVAARLLVVQNRGGSEGGTVEIVHESLIDRWPTLRHWLEEDQEDAAFVAQLAAAAKQWDSKGRPGGLLWRGEATEEARRWHAVRPRELSPRDRAFLDAVFALGARATRIKRTVVIGVIAVLSLAVAGGAVALLSIRDAEQDAKAQAVRADQNATTAQEERDRARQAEKVANDQLEQIRTAQAAKQQAEGVAAERGKQVEMTQGQLEEALAKAEQEKTLAQANERKARDAARLAEQATERERKATEEARQLYLKEKARADEAMKQRSKISTELPK